MFVRCKSASSTHPVKEESIGGEWYQPICDLSRSQTVEVGNPNVVWSAIEDRTLRQHDFCEGASCSPAGPSRQGRQIGASNSPIPSIVAVVTAGPETSNVLDFMEGNQCTDYVALVKPFCMSYESLTFPWPFEILEHLRMHEFAERSFHPFACTRR